MLSVLSLAALLPALPSQAGPRFGNRATRRHQPVRTTRTTRPAARMPPPHPAAPATPAAPAAPATRPRVIVPPPSVAPADDWANLDDPVRVPGSSAKPFPPVQPVTAQEALAVANRLLAFLNEGPDLDEDSDDPELFDEEAFRERVRGFLPVTPPVWKASVEREIDSLGSLQDALQTRPGDRPPVDCLCEIKADPQGRARLSAWAWSGSDQPIGWRAVLERTERGCRLVDVFQFETSLSLAALQSMRVCHRVCREADLSGRPRPAAFVLPAAMYEAFERMNAAEDPAELQHIWDGLSEDDHRLGANAVMPLLYATYARRLGALADVPSRVAAIRELYRTQPKIQQVQWELIAAETELGFSGDSIDAAMELMFHYGPHVVLNRIHANACMQTRQADRAFEFAKMQTALLKTARPVWRMRIELEIRYGDEDSAVAVIRQANEALQTDWDLDDFHVEPAGIWPRQVEELIDTLSQSGALLDGFWGTGHLRPSVAREIPRHRCTTDYSAFVPVGSQVADAMAGLLDRSIAEDDQRTVCVGRTLSQDRSRVELQFVTLAGDRFIRTEVWTYEQTPSRAGGVDWWDTDKQLEVECRRGGQSITTGRIGALCLASLRNSTQDWDPKATPRDRQIAEIYPRCQFAVQLIRQGVDPRSPAMRQLYDDCPSRFRSDLEAFVTIATAAPLAPAENVAALRGVLADHPGPHPAIACALARSIVVAGGPAAEAMQPLEATLALDPGNAEVLAAAIQIQQDHGTPADVAQWLRRANAAGAVDWGG